MTVRLYSAYVTLYFIFGAMSDYIYLAYCAVITKRHSQMLSFPFSFFFFKLVAELENASCQICFFFNTLNRIVSY